MLERLDAPAEAAHPDSPGTDDSTGGSRAPGHDEGCAPAGSRGSRAIGHRPTGLANVSSRATLHACLDRGKEAISVGDGLVSNLDGRVDCLEDSLQDDRL